MREKRRKREEKREKIFKKKEKVFEHFDLRPNKGPSSVSVTLVIFHSFN